LLERIVDEKDLKSLFYLIEVVGCDVEVSRL
jgi:hypothetical protein